MHGLTPRPIQTDGELAAKYEEPGQLERFEEAFRKVIALPKDSVPSQKQIERGPRGRPRKSP